jgi:hypothetical protein
MIDRYTKCILTVIAGALLYLAAIFTPLPSASAQTPTRFPGQSSGPTEVVVVGWQTGQAIVPVSIGHPVQVTSSQPLRVTTERSAGIADRVVLVGWEENAIREKTGRMETFSNNSSDLGLGRALPVQQLTK